MRYRFMAGFNIRKSLQELRVGGDGYDIKEVGGEYYLRHGKGLILLTKEEFNTYFEPFVDYGVEGDGKYEDPKPLANRSIPKEEPKSGPVVKERVLVMDALSDKKPVKPIVPEEQQEPVPPLRDNGEGQLLLF
ncbi:hypothetical protein P4159_05670 [Bacillus thuringiensis]|uniref:hypothetical protein n=1 Tax=Bacillus cereus group TaxID=86661 RepID=UPI000CD9220D|nr:MULTISPECIES: hypothetical protein [Bacillus cereus group]MEC3596920.1 hypothetical protein [Bacillus thuringiensis]MED1574269.1 hypothetical protein [Bacillus paranthracis]MED1836193.1 hypothetical protein [Bacillus thuringiensis]MED2670256.1 hypothetical protein [Bacillus thuringiensis]MED2694211.1 hypothetical protein [Bacillus thuringiensis]